MYYPKGLMIGGFLSVLILIIGIISLHEYKKFGPSLMNHRESIENKEGFKIKKERMCSYSLDSNGQTSNICHYEDRAKSNYDVVDHKYLCLAGVATIHATAYANPQQVRKYLAPYAQDSLNIVSNQVWIFYTAIILLIIIGVPAVFLSFGFKGIGVLGYWIWQAIYYFIGLLGGLLPIIQAYEAQFVLQDFHECIENGQHLDYYNTDKPFWLIWGLVLILIFGFLQVAMSLCIGFKFKAYKIYFYIAYGIFAYTVFTFILLTIHHGVKMLKFSDQEENAAMKIYTYLLSIPIFLVHLLLTIYYAFINHK